MPRVPLPIPAVLLLAGAAAGCASAGPLPAGWDEGLRLRSAHFSLETDVPEEDAREILAAAEGIMGECAGLFRVSPDAVGAEPIPLRVFADLWDYGRYYGLELPPLRPMSATGVRRYDEGTLLTLGPSVDVPAGHMRRFVPWGVPEVAMPFGDDWRGSLRHEIAHVFVDHRGGSVPAWLNEGVAEYVRLSPDADGRRRAVRSLWRDLGRGDAVPLSVVVRMDEEGIAAGSLPAYRTAWALVRHVLATVPGSSLADLASLRRSGERIAAVRTLDRIIVPPE